MTDIAKVMVAIGVGSVLLETFGFVEYIRLRLRDVVINHDYLDTLSKEQKEKLRDELEQSIFSPNTILDKNGLLNVVQNQIRPLLEDYYFNEHITTVECYLKNNVIEKKIHKRICFSQSNKTRKLINPESIFSTSLLCTSQQEITDSIKNYKISRLENGVFVECTDDFEIKYRHSNDKNYPYQAYCEIKNENKEKYYIEENDIVLTIEYTTTVPKKDIIYIQRVQKPCKNFTIHFNYDSSQLYVNGDAFGFMSDNDQSKLITSAYDNSFVIRFIDWIMPGDGVCFTILEKKYIDETN